MFNLLQNGIFFVSQGRQSIILVTQELTRYWLLQDGGKSTCGNWPPYMLHTINPSAGWTNDFESYYLIMDLPDFKHNEVEVIVDPLGSLVIKGSRKTGENERVAFERQFKLPEDSDLGKPVTRKLQNDMLYVTVSRQSVKENAWEFDTARNEETRGGEEPESKDSESESMKGHVGDNEKEGGKTIMEKIGQHKCILFGIFAFAFGVFVASHKI